MTTWTWSKWKKEFKHQQWNQYQLDVMQRLQETSDNIMVSARAGTGKTTLIYGLVATAPSSKPVVSTLERELLLQTEKPKRDPYKITILAFNRHIADEISDSGKIPKRVTCNTAHGMASALLRRVFGGHLIIDDDNSVLNGLTKNLMQEIARHRSHYEYHLQLMKEARKHQQTDRLANLAEQLKWDYPIQPPALIGKGEERLFKQLMAKLVGFCQKTLTEPTESNILAMDNHFGITDSFQQQEVDDGVSVGLSAPAIRSAIQYVPLILDQIETIAERESRVSFDTMLWLIWKWNIQPSQRDLIIVDEAQDANPAQLNLYRQFVEQGARIVCVGDPQQAIQGFAGADHKAWEKLTRSFNAVEMPLAQCFRCDRAIVELAQKIVPDIQPFKDGGEIATVPKDKVIASLRQGDVLISRKNAPLMDFCLKTIKAGFSAKIRGRDVGGEMTRIAGKYIKEIRGDNRRIISVFDMTQCEQGECKRIAKLREELKETQADNAQDKLDCIKFCWQEWGELEINQFQQKILSLFDDENKPQITYATIHRSKGDEAERIFILGSNWLPLTHSKMKSWQSEQEKNLQYVAITRAKKSLFLVPITKKKDKEKQFLEDPYGGMTFPDSSKK